MTVPAKTKLNIASNFFILSPHNVAQKEGVIPIQWNQVKAPSIISRKPMYKRLRHTLGCPITEYCPVANKITFGLPLIGRPTTQSMANAAGQGKTNRLPAYLPSQSNNQGNHDSSAYSLGSKQKMRVNHDSHNMQ